MSVQLEIYVAVAVVPLYLPGSGSLRDAGVGGRNVAKLVSGYWLLTWGQQEADFPSSLGSKSQWVYKCVCMYVCR